MNKLFKSTAAPFYADLHCKCHLISFYVIASHLGPLHLCFTKEKHQQAIRDIKTLLPGIRKCDLTQEDISYCNELFRNVITGQIEIPDFEKNPFLKAATKFQRKTWRKMCEINSGETITYGELAAAVNSPQGARAAGLACNKNPLALIIPCHRVIAAKGPGGFAADLSIKLKLLELESLGKSSTDKVSSA